MAGKYLKAMMQVACPKCKAPTGEPCTPTSSVVHPARREAAFAAGHWDVLKAYDGAYGSLQGEPLECLRPFDGEIDKTDNNE